MIQIRYNHIFQLSLQDINLFYLKYLFAGVIGALQKVYIRYRSLIEALYTLNSPTCNRLLLHCPWQVVCQVSQDLVI